MTETRRVPGAQRQTRQRQVVMEIVRAAKGHPTAGDVHLEARKRLPRISLGTVYRILNVLKQEGAVQDIGDGRAISRFDGRTDRHPHLVCLGCDRVLDFDVDLPPGIADPARASGFEVLDYRLEFYGFCRDCRQKSAPAAATTAPNSFPKEVPRPKTFAGLTRPETPSHPSVALEGAGGPGVGTQR